MISVVINCHNGLVFLDEAIESVLAQTDQNWEMVFWDNASTEPIKDAVLKYRDSRIRYFRGEEFLCLGMARNRALEQVRGEYIAFLDADDYWLPEKLEKQRLLFESDPKAGLVYTDGNIVINGKVAKTVLAKMIPPEGMVFGALLGKYFLIMSSVMLRREVLDGLKDWFNPGYELIADYDLFLRVAAHWPFRCVKSVLTGWRLHLTSTTMKNRPLIGREKRKLLKKLRIGYAPLMREHQKDVERVRAKIMISSALSWYYAGYPKRARRILRKSNRANLKGIFVYGATFFPVNFINTAYLKLKQNPLV